MKTVNANGANMPVLGFGTFRIPGEQVLRILPQAIRTGFRHIDTAQAYRNEAQVGEAIQSSGVPRDEIFLTTKVWVDNYKHADFIASVDESLKKLRTDHVDLLLLHWPNNSVPLAEQIGALNEVQKAGKVKNIGVSNFTTALMAKSVELSDAPIATNQIEYHPYLDQTKVLDTARATGMSITAYFAMADGKVPNEPLLKDIGSRHGKTAAQVVLRWLIQQKDVVTLSKTATESRLSENFDIFDFELSADEMAAIHKLARPNGRIVSPGGLAPDWDKAA
ncbi:MULTISPECIES: aldo/keto reductase [unclassified Rhizobium]|uniref:aldo/keto reductase n=1 Tax=unclassified Rhizobium TaxID=2613769 RepID=UPI000713A33C|nr:MULTISPECIES: aldo/keto reductase [unclassified Rhizobium]KQS96389.1 2,5-didehydrogluconate reductase [Rhizobium sp. Leaf386]KQT06228.1 2,5-didehydrogluconate reductase [Rhizobium sp. Leaf391]KQU09537.1 2,5-didehydrogluconate reductase [Rhizobium sp. Leaf453]